MTNSNKLKNGLKGLFLPNMQRKASEIKNHHLHHFTSNTVLDEAYIQNFITKSSFAIHWHPILLTVEILYDL